MPRGTGSRLFPCTTLFRSGESFEMWGGLAQGVADGGELRAGLAAQGGQGDDADDGDEGQEERVLHQGGTTLGVAEAGAEVGGEGAEDVHGVGPSQDWSPHS